MRAHDPSGQTPLHVAMRSMGELDHENARALVAWLLEKNTEAMMNRSGTKQGDRAQSKAPADATRHQDHYGRTPLHVGAANNAPYEAMKELMDYEKKNTGGADRNHAWASKRCGCGGAVSLLDAGWMLA